MDEKRWAVGTNTKLSLSYGVKAVGEGEKKKGIPPPPLAIGVTETYREGASCVGREDTEKLVICVCVPQGHRSGVLNTPL